MPGKLSTTKLNSSLNQKHLKFKRAHLHFHENKDIERGGNVVSVFLEKATQAHLVVRDTL